MHADGAQVPADRGGHLPDQLRVEGGAPGERYRVGGRAPGGEAREAFLVGEGRDAEPVGAGDPLLGAGQREGAHGRVDRGRPERAGQLAEPEGKQLVEVDGFLHVVLERGDFAALVGGAHPDADELGGLLLEGHGGEQGVGPGLGGEGGVVPGPGEAVRGRRGCPGCGVVDVGGHFPPTPISPCTRDRRANR